MGEGAYLPVKEPRLPAECRWKQPNAARCGTVPLGPELFQMSSVLGRWVQDDYIQMIVSYSFFTHLQMTLCN